MNLLETVAMNVAALLDVASCRLKGWVSRRYWTAQVRQYRGAHDFHDFQEWN